MDYRLIFEGQFVNTRFNYFFTLDCDFTGQDAASWIDFSLGSVASNDSSLIPQVNVTDIVFPLTSKRCELDVHGGVSAQLVQIYIEGFQLPSTL